MNGRTVTTPSPHHHVHRRARSKQHCCNPSPRRARGGPCVATPSHTLHVGHKYRRADTRTTTLAAHLVSPRQAAFFPHSLFPSRRSGEPPAAHSPAPTRPPARPQSPATAMPRPSSSFPSSLLRAAGVAAVVVASAGVVRPANAGYLHEEGWPRGMPAESTQLSAVGVDPYVLGGVEVYIAQRGGNLTQPILVFNETGDLVRAFGGDSIARDATGSWGCHGLSVRSSATKETQIWVNDFVEYTTKVYSPAGKLLAEYGTKGDGGPGLSPLQFDKVADTAFGTGTSADAVFITDGDGSTNHRVVALDASTDLLSTTAAPARHRASLRSPHISSQAHSAAAAPSTATPDILWVGGNNNTAGAFTDHVLGLPLQSMHSIAHHARTNTLFSVDRENNRTLHVDAATGEVKGSWEMADILPPNQGGFETVYGVRTFYSEKYAKDLVVLALGDMDTSDTPPKQGVVVLDGSGVSAHGPGAVKAPLQRISVDSSLCWTPHLLGMDSVNGNLYVACVGANSAVWKYRYVDEE